MTSVIPSLRVELKQAFALIQPQIRGLCDFIKFVPPDTDLYKSVQARLVTLKRRRDLLRAVHHALNDLEDDGYPEIGKSFLPASSVKVLQDSLADLVAAVSVFDPLPIVTILLGEPADK